jgi:hypothetical protein
MFILEIKQCRILRHIMYHIPETAAKKQDTWALETQKQSHLQASQAKVGDHGGQVTGDRAH